MARDRTILSRHRVFAVYLLSILWLAAGALTFAVAANRPFDNAERVLALAAGVSLTYVLAWWIISRVTPAWAASVKGTESGPPGLVRRAALAALTFVYLAVIVTHFTMLGYIPILEALGSGSDVAVSVVRQKGYFDLPLYMRYASDYSVKALGPALLLLTYHFRSRLFWLVLVAGIIYVTGMFARILPVIFFLPLLVYQLTQRRWLHLVISFVLMFGLVMSLTAVSSVALRESVAASVEGMSADGDEVAPPPPSAPVIMPTAPDDWRRTSILYALYERMLIVPGQVMDQWFHYYSEPGMRENGCGYRLLAPLLECEYVHVPTKLYTAYYRENVEQGMRGSLNAASFMTEYANFGPFGFVLSALFGGLLFAVAMLIYRDHPLALPMNVPLIVSAMESNLFTAVNSGAGWLVMTLIFIFFFRSSLK